VRSPDLSKQATSQSGLRPVISGAAFSFVTPVNVISPASTIDHQESRPPENDANAGMYATMTNFANPRLSAQYEARSSAQRNSINIDSHLASQKKSR
jgi:hypothetical protein